MSNLLKYRIWCATDLRWEFLWRESSKPAPSKCPVNTSHDIDLTKTSIVETLSGATEVILRQSPEDIEFKTFGAGQIVFDAPAAGETSHDVALDIDILLLSVMFHSKKSNDGDEISIEVSPEKLVGSLDETVASGSKIISLPQSVMDLFSSEALFRGQQLILDDNVNKNNCGIIIDYDLDGNTVKMKNSTTNEFQAGAMIKITTLGTVPVFGGGSGKIELQQGDIAYRVGDDKIGGTPIVAGEKIRIKYNNTGGSQVRVPLIFSFLY